MTTPYQPGPYGPGQGPHGQQPGGFGPYGQPAQPAQYGPYGQFGQYEQPRQVWPDDGYGQYSQPPPPPPEKKKGPIVAIVVVAVLLFAGAGFGVFVLTKDKGENTAQNQTNRNVSDNTVATGRSEDTAASADGSGAMDAKVGDCIKVNVASATDADVETIDCAKQEATYRVAIREEDDAGECPSEDYVSYTEEGRLLLCLTLNVSDGECIASTETDDKRVDCADEAVTYKVSGVFDGVEDEARCDAAAVDVLTYPQPPLTICLLPPA